MTAGQGAGADTPGVSLSAAKMLPAATAWMANPTATKTPLAAVRSDCKRRRWTSATLPSVVTPSAQGSARIPVRATAFSICASKAAFGLPAICVEAPLLTECGKMNASAAMKESITVPPAMDPSGSIAKFLSIQSVPHKLMFTDDNWVTYGEFGFTEGGR